MKFKIISTSITLLLLISCSTAPEMKSKKNKPLQHDQSQQEAAENNEPENHQEDDVEKVVENQTNNEKLENSSTDSTPPQDSQQPPSTPPKMVGIEVQTSGSVALISFAFEKNGEKKKFNFIKKDRTIDPVVKIYSYFSGKEEEVGNQAIVSKDIGGEMRHIYGKGSWSWYGLTQQPYVFTTRFTNGADPLKGKATILWSSDSEMGKWIIGAKAFYSYRASENRGTAKIKLIGLNSQVEKSDSQVGNTAFPEKELGIIPQ